jgi:hypothetical protein
MKTRSSSGVGMKVDLEFDLETLRITDPGEEAQESGLRGVGATNIMSQIKTNSTVAPGDSEGSNIQAGVDSSKLKSMLAGLKKAE